MVLRKSLRATDTFLCTSHAALAFTLRAQHFLTHVQVDLHRACAVWFHWSPRKGDGESHKYVISNLARARVSLIANNASRSCSQDVGHGDNLSRSTEHNLRGRCPPDACRLIRYLMRHNICLPDVTQCRVSTSRGQGLVNTNLVPKLRVSTKLARVNHMSSH